MRMVTKQNRICTIECGYIFPSDKKIQREFTFSIRSPGCLLRFWRRSNPCLDRSWPMDKSKREQCLRASKRMSIIPSLFAGCLRKFALDRRLSPGYGMRRVR